MTKLSVVFNKIANEATKLDGMASEILVTLKRAKARTLEAFDNLVAEAYAANGWNTGPAGRPAAGVEVRPAPDSVKSYVSQIRAAYKEELDVLGFDTMSALRRAVAECRRPREVASSRDVVRRSSLPEFEGVRLEQDDEFNGALFHDLLVAYELAPEDTREKMQKRLNRVLTEFKPAVAERMVA